MADLSSDPPGGGPLNAQAGGTGVPPAVLRVWDEAEARIFPLVMARPDLYQQSVSTIQRLLGRLRESCPDLPTLLATHEHGAELAAEHVAAAGVAGIRPDLVVAAACAVRYREIVAALAAGSRLAALARARDGGVAWAVVEEIGSPDRARYVPYQRIEAEVATGRAVIVSIGPDETLSRAVHHLDEGEIDLVTGGLRIGRQVGNYLDPDTFAAALQQARKALPAAPSSA
jgi:hypothetical protein